MAEQASTTVAVDVPNPAADENAEASRGLMKAVKEHLDKGALILVQYGSVVLPLKHVHEDRHAEVKTGFPADQ